MSLRGFHIVFITFTTLLSLFMVLWGFLWAPAGLGANARIMGGIGVFGLIVLPAYGVFFYRKARKLHL